MTLFFYILIAFITFIAFLHAWAKRDFNISRTIVINSSKDEVYGLIRQLKKQPLWMPWFKKDKFILKFNGEDGKLEALLYWKCRKLLYEGTQKIIKLNPNRIMETRVLVTRPVKMVLLEYKAVKELDENKIKIVWGIQGNLPFPLSVLSIIHPMDKMYGEDLELGLKNLKKVIEYKHEKTEVN